MGARRRFHPRILAMIADDDDDNGGRFLDALSNAQLAFGRTLAGREKVGDADEKDEEEYAVIWRSHTMQTQVADGIIFSPSQRYGDN